MFRYLSYTKQYMDYVSVHSKYYLHGTKRYSYKIGRYFQNALFMSGLSVAAIGFVPAANENKTEILCSSRDLGWIKFNNIDKDSSKRNKLLKEKINCSSKITLDLDSDLEKYLDILHDDWRIFKDDNNNNKCHLYREFNVDTFDEIMDITSTVFEVAHDANYHPDIQIFGHKKITIDIYSYKLTNLRVNDFIFAARIDENIEKLMKEYME
eukprot:UN02052